MEDMDVMALTVSWVSLPLANMVHVDRIGSVFPNTTTGDSKTEVILDVVKRRSV